MLVQCGYKSCQQEFNLTGYNPLKVQVPCICCGRMIPLADSAQRVYGTAVGKAVRTIITNLSNMKVSKTENISWLVDMAYQRIELIISDAKMAALFELPNAFTLLAVAVAKARRAVQGLNRRLARA